MSDAASNQQPVKQEHWGSRFGVILAVAGSAVGLGNFLRFPGQAVNNGGGGVHDSLSGEFSDSRNSNLLVRVDDGAAGRTIRSE